ncbi:21068_t:CDS:1, partial [Rhizophagus irregularis]
MPLSIRSHQRYQKSRRLRRTIINHSRRFTSNNDDTLRRISNLPQQNSTNSF